ncbi:hypothetical protein QZH41_006290 [Actinostola sp. cb2023]|nr:hypothetical protein QZH41_006290 [Actinostola sp. cb2023]
MSDDETDELSKEYLIKFLALGDSGVGKTSLLYQYTDNRFNPRFVPTIGIDFREKRVALGKQAFSISTRTVLLILSLSRQWESILGRKEWFIIPLTQMAHGQREDKESIYNYGTQRDKKVLLGNKADLEDQRVVDEGEARTLAENLGLKYFETSASTGQNVVKSVEALLDQVMVRMENCVDQATLPNNVFNNNPNRGPKLREVDEANEDTSSGCSC